MIGRAALLALASLLLVAHAPAQAQHDGIDTLLTQQFRFTATELARLRAGDAIARHVPTNTGREIVLVGAIKVAAPAGAMVAMIRDIQRLESGRGFLATRKLSNPPRLDDFAPLQLPPRDLDALRSCRPGRCDVKLGQAAFDRLAAFDWRVADAASRAQALVHEMALAYVEAYRQGGNGQLPVYLDKAKPSPAALEFTELLEPARPLLDRAPGLADHLTDYPARRPAHADEFFYWSVVDFGLKPLFRINQTVVAPAEGADGTRFVVATKQLYASHYFTTALEVRAIIDDPERPGTGHYLVAMTLGRVDGFPALFGGLVRAKVRSASLDAMLRSLRATKRRVEATSLTMPHRTR